MTFNRIGIIALLVLAIGSCAIAAQAELTIYCSLFPQYDFTRTIAGTHAEVYQLLPPGVDSHDYEPSTREVVRLVAADLFIYTDAQLETWVANVLGELDGVTAVRCAEGIDLEALHEAWEAVENSEADEEMAHDDHAHTYDAHIWLDPTLAIVMCERIRDALIAADPVNEADYRANCAAYVQELTTLDQAFIDLFSHADAPTLYFGGKFAYSHFIRHYGLTYESAYASCASEADPSARTIVRMVRAMKDDRATVIFTDEASSGSVARTIAEQTGATVRCFHTIHNLSQQDRDAGATYLSVMYANLENLRDAIA